MKIGIASDIHSEFGLRDILKVPECDVLILAGDIGDGSRGTVIDFANQQLNADGNANTIIQIAGNHEHYRNELKKTYREMIKKSLEYGGQHYFLENDTVVIDGVRFIGATLWTDFNGTGNQAYNMAVASSYMNDYRLIKYKYGENKYGKLSAEVILNKHIESKEYIFNELKKPFDGKTVVITHHAPSKKSVDPHYSGDPTNCYYFSNLEAKLMDIDYPVLWIHGHMHKPSDYTIGNVRVFANPIGYPGENPGTEIVTIEI